MRLKAKCEDYKDDKETIDIFTEEAQRRQLRVSPRASTPSVVSEDEPEQQSAEASKHETEDELGWEMEGDPSPEPEYDQYVYIVLEQSRDGSQSEELDEYFEDLKIMKRVRIYKVCAHRTVANEWAAHVSRELWGKCGEDLHVRYKKTVDGLANIMLEDAGEELTFYVTEGYFPGLSKQEQGMYLELPAHFSGCSLLHPVTTTQQYAVTKESEMAKSSSSCTRIVLRNR